MMKLAGVLEMKSCACYLTNNGNKVAKTLKFSPKKKSWQSSVQNPGALATFSYSQVELVLNANLYSDKGLR